MTLSCDRQASMQGRPESAIRPMEYPTVKGIPQNPAALSHDLIESVGREERQSDREAVFARELEEARKNGIEQGKQMAAAESMDWRLQRAAELVAAMDAFLSGRDAYLAQMETEVVRLALAVAERILHRESQLDPLLLSGAVRMALGQLADSTEVRLRVPEQQRELWIDVVRLMPGLPLRPQVNGDPGLAAASAVLESSLGTADLSVRAQLDEIERGFFDRTEIRGDDQDVPRAGAVEAGKSV